MREVMPSGYRHLHRSILLGRGRDVGRRALDALTSWQMHGRAGLAVAADSPRATVGAVVVLGIQLGPLQLTAPCRVVYGIDVPNRAGFAYGTLPGHPETGEEAFLIDHRPDGQVFFSVRTFSRPATLLTRAGTPLTYLAQEIAVRRYPTVLRGLAGSSEHNG